jgi:hypothetical protein
LFHTHTHTHHHRLLIAPQNLSAPFIVQVPPFKKVLMDTLPCIDFLFGNEVRFMTPFMVWWFVGAKGFDKACCETHDVLWCGCVDAASVYEYRR